MSLVLAHSSTDARIIARHATRTFAHATIAGLAGTLARCPRHAPTPLHRLEALANNLEIGELWAKDERNRFGLPSFKALGGSYAVMKLAARLESERLGRRLDIDDLFTDPAVGRDLVFSAATAGNHGRAVAEAARLVGARAVIFVYDGIPQVQLAAIAASGAEVVHVPGVYEDAIAACRSRSAKSGWTIVSDTSWDGYSEIPTLVMQGYAVLAAEMLAELPEPPTHLFLQAGVGGMAAAVGAYVDQVLGPDAPRLVVVEPAAASPIFASAVSGTLKDVPAIARTRMGRLECYSASPVAWTILNGIAFGYMTISDNEAVHASAVLAACGVHTSATGAAGLAGLMAACENVDYREALRLNSRSRVALVVTEIFDDAPLADGPGIAHPSTTIAHPKI